MREGGVRRMRCRPAVAPVAPTQAGGGWGVYRQWEPVPPDTPTGACRP